MAVNLSKGQRVSLDKGIVKALVGLGWDTNKYDGGYDFDLDAAAFLLGENGKVLCDEDFIFYNNLQSRNEAVVHTGDNLTGAGDGDDEVIEYRPGQRHGDEEGRGHEERHGKDRKHRRQDGRVHQGEILREDR